MKSKRAMMLRTIEHGDGESVLLFCGFPCHLEASFTRLRSKRRRMQAHDIDSERPRRKRKKRKRYRTYLKRSDRIRRPTFSF